MCSAVDLFGLAALTFVWFRAEESAAIGASTAAFIIGIALTVIMSISNKHTVAQNWAKNKIWKD